MTNEEAIKTLKKLKSFHNGSYGTAINEAIKALEQHPCEDCISRETAIDQFIHWYSELLLSQKEEVSFEDILKSLPSVLPQHKKGKWIRYDVDIAFHPLHCSICGWSNHHIINKCIEEFQFCPNCGADMRESEE